MKPDRWRKVDELFEAALEHEPGRRAAFLDQACGNDKDLRREVEKMLDFEKQSEDFIKTDVFNVAAKLITQSQAIKKSASSFTSDSIDDARFIPGDVLSERYRIVGLLGRGGMGEVYRADDLKLKQSVALKFLPASLSADGAALARFYKEVSVARQISHRHVCRVYDVAEFEGQHFISMEFVRGEELSSLLKRIGRLPQAKAIEVARQLCAGLAAVHERGVLHRDLKPANIMLDEHGDVSITDFGIAALAEELDQREAMAGTPAYMSPEQLEGHELTTKSDIYSLGLVLYEVFTGKRAFEASTLPELLRLRRSDTTPMSLGELVPELDPLVERVVFRCLERDPDHRPASALQVAAALPGGDPLAAALAAGETPSPEMVAAAPTEGALKPGVAIGLFAGFLVLLALGCWLTKYSVLYRLTPLNQSPEVLRARSHDIIRRLGYNEAAIDSTDGFVFRDDYLRHIANQDQSARRWDRLRTEAPGPYRFWYRDSPRYFDSSVEIGVDSPALDVSGMNSLYLDLDGRLHWFVHVPPQREPPAGIATPVDWSGVFREAGLDIASFQKTASTWVPLHASDERVAWDGVDPLRPDQKVHVEAASFPGKPVSFATVYTWNPPARQEQTREPGSERIFISAIITIFMIALIGSALVARHNLRLGRGDIK